MSHQLIARGVQMASRVKMGSSFQYTNDGDGERVELPGWGLVLLVATVLIFGILFAAISYTYSSVVAALTIIEDPQTDVYVAVDTLDNDSTPKNPNERLLEPELVALKPQPITSKIRTTIMHLRARAGYWSRFRGLSLAICYYIVRSVLISLFTMFSFTHTLGGRFIAAVVADVILARWVLTWVHIVISEPSEKKWYRRVPSFKSKAWMKIAPAVALSAVAEQLCVIFPAMLATVGPIGRFADPNLQPSGKLVMHAMIQSVGLLCLALALIVLIQIPAQVTVVRVAGSMLPEEDESIVPFDRTFGGKVTPEILGGSGKVGLLEAWKSFTCQSRIRLLKLVAKVCAIQFTLAIMFMMVYIGELRLIMGKDMDKMVKSIADKLHGN